MNFNQFNTYFNPDDKPVYVPLHNKIPIAQGTLTPVTFKEITAQAKFDPYLEIGWIVAEGILVIDIDDQEQADLILNAVLDVKPKTLAVKTTRGLHMYFKSDFNKKTTENLLTCGVGCDTIPHVNGKSYVVLPFKMKHNLSESIAHREVAYWGGAVDEMPSYFRPSYSTGGKEGFFTIPVKGARNDTLNRYLWKLKQFVRDADDRSEIIQFINKYLCTEPLSESELVATVLREKNNEELPEETTTTGGVAPATSSRFFHGDTFMHNIMGDYLIKSMHIKRDRLSKDLYYFDTTKKIYVNDIDSIFSEMLDLVPTLKNFQRQEVMKYIDHRLVKQATSFNANPFKIVFKNGIFDLETRLLEPMRPEYLETIQLDVKYNPDAKSEAVDDFFKTATGGDEEIEKLLFEAIGYSMLKTNELQKAFLLTGEGRNGKSTYLDLIKAILGKHNTTSVSLKDLAGNFRASSLVNKLASLAGDISNQPLTESDLFKSIVAGEEVMFERKFKDAFSDTVFSTLFFAANSLPRSTDTTFGFYRRFCVIPFNAKLEGISRVEGMKFKGRLCNESSREYAAFKAVQAILHVLETSLEFTEPQAVKDMLLQYRITNDNVLMWLYHGIKNDVLNEVVGKKPDDVYIRYSVWVEANGYKEVRSDRFFKTLESECNLITNGYGKYDVNL